MNEQSTPAYLVPGTRGLLIVGDRRFLVAVLTVQEQTLRVSFPMRDFPVDGMSVLLEFHKESGYAAFECEVMETPSEVGDGLRLRLLRDTATESRHRGAWRVPSALPLAIKDHVHPRRHRGTAENVSANGMFMATEARLETGGNFDFTLTMEGMKPFQGVGQVMHEVPASAVDGLHRYGVRFVGTDPLLSQAIARYVWQHVRRTYGLEGRA